MSCPDQGRLDDGSVSAIQHCASEAAGPLPTHLLLPAAPGTYLRRKASSGPSPWPIRPGGGQNGTFGVRPGHPGEAAVECPTHCWREARAQAAAGLGDPVLARPRTALRDRALFDLAIDSKLRGCDVVKIRIGELVSGGRVRTRATVTQQKTGRPVQFELLEAARSSLQAWLEHRGGRLDDYAFPSRTDHANHISTRQYARLVDEWVLPSAYGARITARIRSDGPRHRSSTRPPATCGRYSCCWVTPRSRARCAISGWTSKTRSLSLSTQSYEARRSAGITRRPRQPTATAPLLNPEELPKADIRLRRTDRRAQLSDNSGIARRDMVIGQYLIDANIRPMLLARVVFRNATRARRNLRVKK